MSNVIQQIQFKRGTAADLTSYLTGTRKLLVGEPAYEIDTGNLKIGDGNRDYSDLPYISGENEDSRFVIHDPEANQVLLFDELSGKWINKNLSDDNSIVYLAEHGLTIKGYEQASQGQMLVKDQALGLAWVNPISTSELQDYVNQAQAHAVSAGNSAISSGNSASEASRSALIADSINHQTMQWVNEKFWWGTLEEYNALESINPGTFYFISA